MGLKDEADRRVRLAIRCATFGICTVILATGHAAAQTLNDSGYIVKGLGGAVFESGEPLASVGAGAGVRVSSRLNLDGEFVRVWGEAAFLSTLLANVEVDVFETARIGVYAGAAVGSAWADYREPFAGPRNWGVAWNAGGGVRASIKRDWAIFVDARGLFVHRVFSRTSFPRIQGGIVYSLP